DDAGDHLALGGEEHRHAVVGAAFALGDVADALALVRILVVGAGLAIVVDDRVVGLGHILAPARAAVPDLGNGEGEKIRLAHDAIGSAGLGAPYVLRHRRCLLYLNEAPSEL